MYKFVSQTTKLLKSSSNYQKYYATNRYTTAGYGMPNCTTYALGRVNQLQDLNNLSYNNFSGWHGNGTDWGESGMIGASWTHSQIPKLGAVACFKDLAGEGGHVAIVESILDNGNVTISNSGWAERDQVGNENASTWWWLNTNIDIKTHRSKSFKYYLYPPFIEGDPGPGPGPGPTPKKKDKNFNWVLFTRNRHRF